jgi:hypothetical protein
MGIETTMFRSRFRHLNRDHAAPRMVANFIFLKEPKFDVLTEKDIETAGSRFVKIYKQLQLKECH